MLVILPPTKDSPIFIYVQDSKVNNTNKQNKTTKANFITKLKDTKTLSFNINLDRNITRDEYNNIIPIDPINIFLSFIPFKNNYEANNKNSQKLQITAKDLDNGYVEKKFKIPLFNLRDSEMFREWKSEGESENKEETPKDKYYIDKEGYLQGIKYYKIKELNHGKLAKINAIILHRTKSSTLQSALNSFKSGIGSHFIIDKNGDIYQCLSIQNYTYHIGKIRSKAKETKTWNKEEEKHITSLGWKPQTLHEYEKKKSYPTRYPINSDSIGIEVVSNYKNNKWEEATREQKESIKILIDLLKMEYNLTNKDIYEHDKIAYKTGGEGADLYDYNK